MEFSSHGIPIVNLKEKARFLTICLKDESWEDAAGHLCDLLAFVGKEIDPKKSLQEIVAYYGKNPTPIKDE
jgi:hypothetical protein